MSVQVSYKKQTLMTFIGLLILFAAIEIVANVWWIAQINCEFEDSEIFQDMSDSEKKDMCFDLYKIQTSGKQLIPNQNSGSLNINNWGSEVLTFLKTNLMIHTGSLCWGFDYV